MKRLLQLAGALFCVMTLLFLAAEAMGWLEESRLAAWVDGVRGSPAGRIWAGLLLGTLLASDLVLPLPSSVLMTLCGATCGFAGGFAVATAGAMVGAWLGFGLCRRYGRPAFRRLIDDQPGEVERVGCWLETYGAWGIVLSRSVPMLTEVVSCLCGLGELSWRRFTLLAALGTLPVCAVYAYAGSRGLQVGSGLALLVALVLPGLGFILLHRIRR